MIFLKKVDMHPLSAYVSCVDTPRTKLKIIRQHTEGGKCYVSEMSEMRRESCTPKRAHLHL
jgi:hypothetical protein